MGAGVIAGLAGISFGVMHGYLQPVFFTGVVILGLPFLAASLIALYDRVREGPLVVPSMPSAPAFDPDDPRPSTRRTETSAQRTIRAPGAGRKRYRVTTRLPY